MLTLVVVLLLFVPTWSRAQEPEEVSEGAEVSEEAPEEVSLAEWARRERLRRSKLGQPDRVITNANISESKGLVSTSGAPPAVESEMTEGEGESAESIEENTGPDLESWQASFAEAVQNLESAVNLGRVLELRMVDLNNSYFSASGPAKADIQQQLQETRQEIPINQRDVQAARQALSVLESEAAADGIPPGTIREMIGDLPSPQSIRDTPGS
jgi:hypothetical protein